MNASTVLTRARGLNRQPLALDPIPGSQKAETTHAQFAEFDKHNLKRWLAISTTFGVLAPLALCPRSSIITSIYTVPKQARDPRQDRRASDASRLLAQLDAAGIQRAVVLVVRASLTDTEKRSRSRSR